MSKYLALALLTFFRLPFCLCLPYFLLILLEASRNLFVSVINFTFSGASIAITSPDGMSVSSSILIVSTRFVAVLLCLSCCYCQTNYLQCKCHLFSSLNRLFSSKTSSIKSIISFCCFCLVTALSISLYNYFNSENSSSLFFCFYCYCFSILNLWFNVGVLNFFMFQIFKLVLY